MLVITNTTIAIILYTATFSVIILLDVNSEAHLFLLVEVLGPRRGLVLALVLELLSLLQRLMHGIFFMLCWSINLITWLIYLILFENTALTVDRIKGVWPLLMNFVKGEHAF